MESIILTGLVKSGKDTVANYLVMKYGFSKYVFSDVIVEEIMKRGIPNTKMNQSVVGDELREQEGMDAIAKRLVKKV